MAVTVVNKGFVAGTRTLATVDLTGAGHASGDMFLYQAVHSDTSGDHNPPSGVTRLTAAAGILAATASAHWAGYKVLTGSETTLDFTFTHAAGSGTAIGWIILRGIAETSFTLGTNYKEITTSSAATTITTAAIDVPANGWLVSMFAVDASASGGYTCSAGTEEYDGEGLTSTFLAVAGYTEEIAAGGTGVTRTGTYNVSFVQGAHSFVVTPAGGTGDPAVDTNATIDVGEDFRVRFELQELNSAYAYPTGFLLYASKNGGAYAQVTGATDLRVVATAAYADGDETTNLMTGSTGTFVPGAGDEDGSIGPIVIESLGHTEIEWSLEIVTAVEGDTFDLRVYKADGTPLDSYGATPRITAAIVPTDPVIGLTPSTLSFNATEGGGDPADKGVTITNTGAGTLAWSVSDDAAWLTCTPASGSLAADASEVLTVSPATGSLTPGTYNATITITDAAATNSPQTVAVTFNVTVVSGFPVALEGIYFETSGFAGPHIDANGNLYLDTEAPNSVPTTQEQEENHIQKSTDGGHTWIYDVDGANSPTRRDMESLSTVLDANGLLHIAWQKSGYNTYYARFRTSAHATNPDTWVDAGEDITGAQSGITDQSVSIAVRSDGSVVAFYISTNKDLSYRIRSAAGVWGTAVVVLSDTDYQQVFVDLSKQDDTVHFAYGDYVAKTLHYNTLSPSNVLGTAQQIATGVITEHKPMINRGLLVYDNAGIDHVYLAWCRQSDHHVLGVEIVAGTPGADEVISDVGVYVNPPNMLSNQAVAALSYDQATGTAHVVYSDASTHDIWRSERPLGGAWTTPEEIIDAVDCQAISCNVIQYPGGDKVLGLFYDTDVGVPSGGQMYYSEELLEASTAAARTAADTLGTTDTVARAALLPRTAADSLGTTDTTSRAALLRTRTAVDSLGTSDTVARAALQRTRTAADTLGTTDTAVGSKQLTRTASDSLGTTDTTTRAALALTRTAADSLGTTDAATRAALARTRAASDTLGTADTTARAANFPRTAADTLGTSDTATRATLARTRVAGDTLGTTDSAAGGKLLTRTADDSLGTTDSVARAALALTRTALDSLGTTDSATRAALSRARTASDTLGTTDAVARATLSLARAAADSLGTADTTARAALLRIRAAGDTLGTTDVAVGGKRLTRTAVDALGTTDAASRFVGLWVRTATDTLGTTDSATGTTTGDPLSGRREHFEFGTAADLLAATLTADMTAPARDVAAALDLAYRSQVLADNPSGYWRLEESAGTTAVDDAAANDGTYVNTPTLNAAGLIIEGDHAVTLTAAQSEEITLPGNALSTNGTVEFWFRWTAGSQLFRDHTGANGWILGFDNAGGFSIRIAGTTVASSKLIGQVRDGLTHHMVVTKAGAQGRVYLDGALIASTAVLADTASLNPWHAGRAGTAASYADATFDEIAIYPVALGIDRILAHYNAGASRIATFEFATGGDMTAAELAAAAATFDSYSSRILADTPIGYWRLGEPSGTAAADQAGSHPGVYVGAPTLAAPGGITEDPDTAVTFAANQYVTVADTGGTFDFAATAFTLECWVKRTAPVSQNRGLMARGTASWFLRFNGSNQLELLRENQASLGTSTGTLADTTGWHHIAMTRSAAGATRFYIDGADVGGFTGGTIAAAVGTVLTLAANTQVGTNYFVGSMDEIAIYSTVLTPTQIAGHHEAGRRTATFEFATGGDMTDPSQTSDMEAAALTVV